MIGPFVAACSYNYDAACALADARMTTLAPYLLGVLIIEIVVLVVLETRKRMK